MKTHFFVKLIPRRPTFPQDISPEEAAIMQTHSAYWANLMRQGRVHAYGPVMDPEGTYGMGVLSADSIEEVEGLLANDPASSLMNFRICPMRAFLPVQGFGHGPEVVSSGPERS
jgi:uncharacterized protein YciI